MTKQEEETQEETQETNENEETQETQETQENNEEGYKGRYSQFAAKTADEYLEKLETAYANSSTEAQRLNSTVKEREQELEVITKIVNSDPNLKKGFQEKIYDTGYESKYDNDELSLSSIARVIDEKLDAKLDAKLSSALKENPALKKIESEEIENNRQIFDKFAKEHPEVAQDLKIQGDLDDAFQAVVATMTKKGGKVDFDRALNKAWRIISDDDKEYEKILQKDANSMSSGGSSQTKSGTTKTLTPAEKSIAKKMGLTDEQYLEGKTLIN